MNRVRALGGGGVLIAVLLAGNCKGESGKPADTRPTSGPPAAAAAPAPKPDVCALAQDADVARALGARVRNPARGQPGSCDYDLDFGDRRAGFFYVWAGKPAMYFSRELASGGVETLPGLGQDAWVEHTMPEGSWDLHVLVASDLALEVKGDAKDRVLALGRFLASRIR
jgi:hypothetical protein